MRNRSGEKIKLSGIDELLGVVNEESAMEIDIASIHPFAGHPFKVIDDDKMQDLVESVRENGVITPVLIRPAMENQYEMISGHRRMHAAKLAGNRLILVFSVMIAVSKSVSNENKYVSNRFDMPEIQ